VSLLEQALEAHGGLERWRTAEEVVAELRSGGFALASKLVAGPLRRYEARASVAEPRTVLDPYPSPGQRGVFAGDQVWIESADSGERLARRSDPRRLFPGLRRRVWWDRLDALYFAGYALWNYLTTPYLLTRPGVEVREEGRHLHVTFPPQLPTHSREQTFQLDEQGLIVRHDYTAEVFGGWAKAKHECHEHRQFDGLVFPTRRRVTPRNLPFPTLVWIEVDSVRVRHRA
jgi:hypothetical protein